MTAGLARVTKLSPAESKSKPLIQDASYFASMVRKKQYEIEEEMQRLESKIDQLDQEAEREKCEQEIHHDLITEVKGLELQLSDFNAVMNAIREGTRSEDIMQYAQEVSEKNSEIAKEVDKICLSRNKYEQDFMEMSSDIDSFYKQAETIIGISDSTKLEKFLIMRESLSDVERDLEEDKLQIQKLSHEIGQKQIETRGQHTRTEYKVLEKRLASLEVEMQQLIVEQEILNMSSSEAQNFQLQKLKESQKTMAELDVTRDNLQEQIAEMQEKLRSFEKDMALLDGPSTAQMDSNQLIEGIRSSEMTLEESTQEAAKIDTSIKQLELRVTELLSEQENFPTKQELKDMKTEVILRNDEVTNCHQTIEILKSEHDRRVQEVRVIYVT